MCTIVFYRSTYMYYVCSGVVTYDMKICQDLWLRLHHGTFVNTTVKHLSGLKVYIFWVSTLQLNTKILLLDVDEKIVYAPGLVIKLPDDISVHLQLSSSASGPSSGLTSLGSSSDATKAAPDINAAGELLKRDVSSGFKISIGFWRAFNSSPDDDLLRPPLSAIIIRIERTAFCHMCTCLGFC